jgi:cysteine desulfurase
VEVYFDNSATTKPFDEVLEAMLDIMKNYYGNPSSAHTLGLKAEQKMLESRDIVAKTLNCNRDEIIFTSGGSESNNFLIRGFLKKDSHIITTKIEHSSVINTCRELQTQGVKVTYLNVDNNGKIDLKELENSIVTIIHVNNETGVVQDIEAVGKIIKEKSSKIKFHVDAVQSYGKYKIDVKKMNIDLLSASGHKIHGPRGVGIAYVRKGLMPRPLIYGGGQERSFRSGTENLAAIYGLARAAEKSYNNIEKKFEKVLELKKYFIEKIQSMPNIKVNSNEGYSPYILNISFVGIRGEVLLHLLEEKGIYVSAGSACSAKSNKVSYVLQSMGLKDEESRGGIRFSFSEYNSKEEVEYTIDNIDKALKFLRRVSK